MGNYMGDNNDDELMDMWMMGVLDEKGGSLNKGSGCLGCVLLMIAVPAILIFGIISIC